MRSVIALALHPTTIMGEWKAAACAAVRILRGKAIDEAGCNQIVNVLLGRTKTTAAPSGRSDSEEAEREARTARAAAAEAAARRRAQEQAARRAEAERQARQREEEQQQREAERQRRENVARVERMMREAAERKANAEHARSILNGIVLLLCGAFLVAGFVGGTMKPTPQPISTVFTPPKALGDGPKLSDDEIRRQNDIALAKLKGVNEPEVRRAVPVEVRRAVPVEIRRAIPVNRAH
jgi:hypothetical protein